MRDNEGHVLISRIRQRASTLELLNYLRDSFYQITLVFLFFSFPFTILALIVIWTFADFEMPFLVSVLIGGALGLGMTLLWVVVYGSEFFLSVRDYLSSERVKLEVKCVAATRALDIRTGQELIALDCGRTTLLVAGEWWVESNGQASIAWLGNRLFPVTRFILTFLPAAGKVTSVEIYGTEVPVQFVNAQDLPLLRVSMSGKKEIQVVRKPIAETVDLLDQ